jgi:hypothetical protein
VVNVAQIGTRKTSSTIGTNVHFVT